MPFTDVEKDKMTLQESIDALVRIEDFQIQRYVDAERKYVDLLYMEVFHKYADRNAFVHHYIETGMAENFRRFYFGEQHLIRKVD